MSAPVECTRRFARRSPGPSTQSLLLAALLLLPVFSDRAAAQAGGIEVSAAETLFAQGPRVSFTHFDERRSDLYNGSHTVFAPLGRRLVVRRDILGIDHGVRRDITLSALLPWVRRRASSLAGTLSSSGPGDIALLAKVRAHQELWMQGAFNVAVIGGLEAPTGSTGERDAGLRLAPGMQPGSGAWNPFAAVSATLDIARLRFDARAFYKRHGEGAQDLQPGDFVSLEVDAAYHFLHTRYPGPTASAKLGLQWRRQDRDELASPTWPPSAGHRRGQGLGARARPAGGAAERRAMNAGLTSPPYFT